MKLNRNNKTGFLLFLILMSAMITNAQAETSCDVGAFVTDPSSGVNVRSEPGTDAKILRTVPKDEGVTMFFIVGSKGDWLKVNYATDSKNNTAFSGTGWVHAPLLSVTERRNKYKIFKTPILKSERINVGLLGHFLPLESCSGEWLKVRLPVTGTGVGDLKVFGWMPAGTYCGNPWSECDY
jgi:uncharacterized protein YraI